ncbi:hypothetical protein HAX54_027275 [Datura stramonium]|uniref:Uncharacterized protein n=1 Tax=Datura stramonium TaxID=4076 RepID=A0ABS8V4B3_DATST|nr:hypothetical protein [Datura stramonium]
MAISHSMVGGEAYHQGATSESRDLNLHQFHHVTQARISNTLVTEQNHWIPIFGLFLISLPIPYKSLAPSEAPIEWRRLVGMGRAIGIDDSNLGFVGDLIKDTKGNVAFSRRRNNVVFIERLNDF